MRVAFIGNALPRRCGIATFTTDLELAVSSLGDVSETAIIAMCDPGSTYDFPPHVVRCIAQAEPESYAAAARFINAEGFDVVCLQHEFGIFGGEAGSLILGLVLALEVPLVTVFHTVLDRPSDPQRQVMNVLIAASARVVVMARKGRGILRQIYGAPPEKIDIIPHGIPDVPLATSHVAKEKLGYGDREVILTFGLISPNKGIETMIEAMPAVIEEAENAVYVVMGATHPKLLAETGEAYRETLIARVQALGIDDHVVFLNQFVDRPALLDHIAMCDVYVTPYLVESQMTSGTLAYSHGLGRPVVSTPYWHAAELLSDGSGVLVSFGDTAAMGNAVGALLANDSARLAMGRKAYAASRAMTWANTGKRFADIFRTSLRGNAARMPLSFQGPVEVALPAPAFGHLGAMCDDTGMFQHAVHSIPDRAHGYCIDDNARALLLCCELEGDALGEAATSGLTDRFAAFIQHGWNPDNRRFRNFMGFSRQWLEPAGSEDSHGRTLWALGVCAASRTDPVRAQWAKRLFGEALGTVAHFTSPRAWAFTLLGLDGYCRVAPQDRVAGKQRLDLAYRLDHLLSASETSEWTWFEDRLSYDNARLSQALIVTGMATGADHLIHAGLRSLRWLVTMQTAPQGHFRPVGSQGFMLSDRSSPKAFDQQPLEACATIAACATAFGSDPVDGWLISARRAFAWFLGDNDLAIPLVDIVSGSCRDGLHPDRANENRGAESVLSYLLGLNDMRRLEPAARRHPEPSIGGNRAVPLHQLDA
ncbi:glycosyltransferase family 4 protein [Novosphingobium flavum]|uniref:Glycosyltransferase family 4 protein n=1 Tax=Novosphingobium flavum TaxID=1778672 RepID=A0A7X1FQ13_9SPHN|nr:glycosyltransferase family 4 protein [Novosphingobium flavum]MBC2664818.1 glycosyltransferase family 4 protein [Novosphingobium flavum]